MELWPYVPHNSILGLLAYTGILGFAGYWLAFPTAVFLNARGQSLPTWAEGHIHNGLPSLEAEDFLAGTARGIPHHHGMRGASSQRVAIGAE